MIGRIFSFGRKPRPCDTEDWRVGDLAECIYPGPWRDASGFFGLYPAPELGSRHIVVALDLRLDAPFLVFARFGSDYSYRGSLFRKIVPTADAAIRAEPEFLDLLRRLSPTRREREDA